MTPSATRSALYLAFAPRPCLLYIVDEAYPGGVAELVALDLARVDPPDFPGQEAFVTLREAGLVAVVDLLASSAGEHGEK